MPLIPKAIKTATILSTRVPFPPIGFQVPHHILAVGSLPLRKLERLAFEA
jgi:hypothetical protein